MEPFVWRIKLAHNISLDEAILQIEGVRCLFCGKIIEKQQNRRGRRRRFCSNNCKWRYKHFQQTRRQILGLEIESENEQEIGTIFIRPKLDNETWQQYHQYLQSLKPWAIR